MKNLYKASLFSLFAAFSILLTGCSNNSADQSIFAIAQALTRQSSVVCTVEYTLTLDATIDETNYDEITQKFSSEIQTDLLNKKCHAIGTLFTILDSRVAQQYDMEAYSDSTGTYYRYNDFYYHETDGNILLNFSLLPNSMAENGNFQKQEATELIYGSECTVYSGSGLTADNTQAFYSFLSRQTIPLSGCAATATLRAYCETELPATLSVQYNDLESLAIQIEDNQGNKYSLKALDYEITYHNYGTSVDIVIPDNFRSAALDGLPDPEMSAAIEENSDTGIYRIYNDTNTYYVEVAAPQFMLRDEDNTAELSFYYNYSNNDTEIICYRIANNYSVEQQEEYSSLLLDTYRDTDELSKITASDIKSVTIGDYSVNYRTYSMTMEDVSGTFHIMQIYSWATSDADAADSIEVEITEYNGDENASLIDAETELEAAYSAIQGTWDCD